MDEDKEEEAWGESQQKCQEWHWFSTLDMKPEAEVGSKMYGN